MKTVTYKEEMVVRALNLLNGVETKGVENAQRLLTAFAILKNPQEIKEEKEEETDGTDE